MKESTIIKGNKYSSRIGPAGFPVQSCETSSMTVTLYV
jgi:hypothetical protein